MRVANLTCKDGSRTVLPDIYVPSLCVNLLLARPSYDIGLCGSFESNGLKFKLDNRTMFYAKMVIGLYIVKHGSRKFENLIMNTQTPMVFAGMDLDHAINEMG